MRPIQCAPDNLTSIVSKSEGEYLLTNERYPTSTDAASINQSGSPSLKDIMTDNACESGGRWIKIYAPEFGIEEVSIPPEWAWLTIKKDMISAADVTNGFDDMVFSVSTDRLPDPASEYDFDGKPANFDAIYAQPANYTVNDSVAGRASGYYKKIGNTTIAGFSAAHAHVERCKYGSDCFSYDWFWIRNPNSDSNILLHFENVSAASGFDASDIIDCVIRSIIIAS